MRPVDRGASRARPLIVAGALWLAAAAALFFVRTADAPAPLAAPAWEALPRSASARQYAPGRFRLGDGGRGQSAVSGPHAGRLAWVFRSGGPVTGQPVVGPDQRVYFSSHDGALRAVTAAGRLLWRRELHGPALGGPLVDDRGNVYAGSDAGLLLSFDAEGNRRFVARLPQAIDTSPVLDPSGSLVLCAAGRTLFALSTRDGARVFEFSAFRKIFTSPVVDREGIYFGAQDHRVYALTPRGAKRWEVDTGSDVDASPVLAPDGTLYVAGDDRTARAIDRRGKVRHERELGSYLRAPLALGSDRVLVLEHGLRPALLALDRTLQIVGRLPLGLLDSSERSGRSGPVVDRDGVVYFGTLDHRVVAVGEQLLWSHRTGGEVHSSPVIARDGTLYIGSDDGGLYAFR